MWGDRTGSVCGLLVLDDGRFENSLHSSGGTPSEEETAVKRNENKIIARRPSRFGFRDGGRSKKNVDWGEREIDAGHSVSAWLTIFRRQGTLIAIIS